MGFIKANKQINNFFHYVSLSCINFISLLQRTEIVEEWVVCGLIYCFFIKLKYSAQAICSPCFPFIIFPSPVFLQPGNPSSCPYHCSGSTSLPWAAPPGPWFRGGCRARIALDIPVKQFSYVHLEQRFVEYCYFLLPPFPPGLNFCELGKLIPTKSAGMGGQGTSCKTEVHSILIFSWATLTF